MLVEVCANSLESAVNAQRAGANRVELCAELGVGGITPSHGLIKLVREQLSIPLHVLIRPRSGHFTYSDDEFDTMCADIEFCKMIGVDGIVSGALLEDHGIDIERTATLVALAKPLHFTFHRAFDWTTKPQEALPELEGIGVRTVLTSGQHMKAEEGLPNLKAWQKTSKVTIMAGAGITPDNAQLFRKAGLKAIHLSGSVFGNHVVVDSKISMNSEKHLFEDKIAVTNVDVVRQIVHAIKNP